MNKLLILSLIILLMFSIGCQMVDESNMTAVKIKILGTNIPAGTKTNCIVRSTTKGGFSKNFNASVPGTIEFKCNPAEYEVTVDQVGSMDFKVFIEGKELAGNKLTIITPDMDNPNYVMSFMVPKKPPVKKK